MVAPLALPLGKRVRYNEALKAQSLRPIWQVLRVVELQADAKLAKRLEIGLGDPVVLFERLSQVDELRHDELTSGTRAGRIGAVALAAVVRIRQISLLASTLAGTGNGLWPKFLSATLRSSDGHATSLTCPF